MSDGATSGYGADMGRRDIVGRMRTYGIRLLDPVAAAGLTVGALLGIAGLHERRHLGFAICLAVACTASTGWRTRYPMPAAFVAITGLFGYQVATRDSTMGFEPLAVLLTLYSVGRHARLDGRRLAVGGLLAYALATSAFPASSEHSGVVNAAGSWLLFAALPCAGGLTVRRHAGRTRLLAANLERLQGEDELRMRRLAAEERHRVARELHDVVGHCVSVMVIQASGARLIAASDLAAASDALRIVESCGREALADLRRTMGVLRREDGELAGPAPGLGQLDTLIERARVAGLPTRAQFVGNPLPLSPGLDLVAYRVVQEALTNAVKHAGPARAAVTVSFSADALELTVTDDGTGSATVSDQSPQTGGHGLLGMQERVALYGGQLRTGHCPQGGYQVYARLPLHNAAPTHISDVPASPRMPATPEPVQGRRWRPTLVDVAVSTLWFTAMAIEAATSHARRGSVALNLMVVAAMAASALWRRRFPALFVVVVGALAAVLSSGITSLQHASVSGLYVALVAPYTVGSWARRPRTEAALGFWLIGASIIAVVTHTSAADLFGASLFAVVAWASGRAVQAERELSAALRETGRRLDAERKERARLAVVDERTRIARELHAMVARHVTVMVVQAEGAQKLMHRSLPAATDAMRTIEETGREALAQMRRLLGVLRNDHDENAERRRQPQSGLAQIQALRDVYT